MRDPLGDSLWSRTRPILLLPSPARPPPSRSPSLLTPVPFDLAAPAPDPLSLTHSLERRCRHVPLCGCSAGGHVARGRGGAAPAGDRAHPPRRAPAAPVRLLALCVCATCPLTSRVCTHTRPSRPAVTWASACLHYHLFMAARSLTRYPSQVRIHSPPLPAHMKVVGTLTRLPRAAAGPTHRMSPRPRSSSRPRWRTRPSGHARC